MNNTLAAGNPLRWCSITGTTTGGTATALSILDATNAAPPHGSLFFLSKIRVKAGDSAGTLPKLVAYDLEDLLPALRAIGAALVIPDGVATVSADDPDVIDFNPPIPCLPVDGAHSPGVTFTPAAGAAATITWYVTGSGFWTNNPPTEAAFLGQSL
jgi:hypothetical protein